MEQRELGRTTHRSTVVTFGTAGLGRVDQVVADRAVRAVLEHGVNHIDIAPSYGEAMERLAPWMPRIRDRVFLATKTTSRTKDTVWDAVRTIQRRLGVDSFDLFQLHSVSSMEALDAITAPGGAIEALVEMRNQGVTRWLGITGHGPDVPKVHFEALRRFDFDTIMFPVGAAIFRNPDYRSNAEVLLAETASRNVGVQIIKSIARGGWGDHKREHATWYDPYRLQTDIDRALWWALSQPVHTAPSAGDVNLLPRVLDAAERFVSLSTEAQDEILQSQRPPLPEPDLGIPSAVI